jgi:hypothetical protein
MINIFVSYSHRDQIWFVKDSQYDLIPWLQDALRRETSGCGTIAVMKAGSVRAMSSGMRSNAR